MEHFMSNMIMTGKQQVFAKLGTIYKINQYDPPLFSTEIVKKQNRSFKN